MAYPHLSSDLSLDFRSGSSRLLSALSVSSTPQLSHTVPPPPPSASLSSAVHFAPSASSVPSASSSLMSAASVPHAFAYHPSSSACASCLLCCSWFFGFFLSFCRCVGFWGCFCCVSWWACACCGFLLLLLLRWLFRRSITCSLLSPPSSRSPI